MRFDTRKAIARLGGMLYGIPGGVRRAKLFRKKKIDTSKIFPKSKKALHTHANIEVAEKVHTVLTEPRILRYSVLQTRSKSSQI